jgi:hypothetical protein
MPFFTKKPVTVEAREFDGSPSSADAILRWIAINGGMAGLSAEKGKLSIETLEGLHLASPGDWIIKGIAGEFYPCKPRIFEKTYQQVFEPS